jgi:hypothetical protein
MRSMWKRPQDTRVRLAVGRFFTDPAPPRKKSDDFFIGEKPHRFFCCAVQTAPQRKNPIVTPTNTKN